MTKEQKSKPQIQNTKERQAAERAERLRKQLRANLQRRKSQSRARNTDAEPEQ